MDPFEGPAFNHVTSAENYNCTVVGKNDSFLTSALTVLLARSAVFALLSVSERACALTELPNVLRRHDGPGRHLLRPGQNSKGEDQVTGGEDGWCLQLRLPRGSLSSGHCQG